MVQLREGGKGDSGFLREEGGGWEDFLFLNKRRRGEGGGGF